MGQVTFRLNYASEKNILETKRKIYICPSFKISSILLFEARNASG